MNDSGTYGLDPADIESIVSVLRKNERITEAVLFGSRAKGNCSPVSDIDIALKGEGLRVADIAEALAEIHELPIPNKTDLVIFDRIEEPALIGHINRVGITLYRRSSSG
ncbi:MAG: nucleotidyltransferase domain-containing protein [Bacteroidales bacterium]|nr:nucleotidyltransferase domain-containing protein [Bacteroidales bacterium]